jgi:pimeloyl-ACP methyl ester carboxylesterase
MGEVDEWVGRASSVQVGGEAIAVIDVPARRSGNGPPLLVIHGFPTSSIDFAPVLDPLAEDRRVVLLDLPGYGLSAKSDRPYSLFGQTDVVEAVAGHAGLREVDLLTHDMGDSVGGELLARALDGTSPLQVRRRIVTNGSVYLGLAQLTEGQKLLRALPDEALPEDAAPDVEALAAALIALCAPSLQAGEPARRLHAAAALTARSGGTRLLPRLIRYLDERAAHEGRWTGAIETHSAPLAVVWGRHDPIAVAAMVDRLATRRPDTVVRWLDAGHWPMVERPDAFAEAALAFLDGVDPGSP